MWLASPVIHYHYERHHRNVALSEHLNVTLYSDQHLQAAISKPADTNRPETGKQHAIPETAKSATNGATKTKAGKCVDDTTINH
jgi:hypothetical protein